MATSHQPESWVLPAKRIKRRNAVIRLFDAPLYADWMFWLTAFWAVTAILALGFGKKSDTHLPRWGDVVFGAITFTLLFGLLPTFLRLQVRRWRYQRRSAPTVMSSGSATDATRIPAEPMAAVMHPSAVLPPAAIVDPYPPPESLGLSGTSSTQAGFEAVAVARPPVSLVRARSTPATKSTNRLGQGASQPMNDVQPDPGSSARKPRIFIVHGHNLDAAEALARVIEMTTSAEAVILHEQSDDGKTVIEKFESHAIDIDIDFAVIMLSPDDVGAASAQASALQKRARQNVIFEMGWFMGSLKRAKVAMLIWPGVEEPSDVNGIVYIRRDDAGNWKRQLIKRFDGAGIPVDYSKL